MGTDITKVKPYESKEIILDGDLDTERLMATWKQKYEQEIKKQKNSK